MALVLVGEAGERPAVGQPELALGTLERLDRRLLVDREHDRVLRRREVEPDDVGGLGGELGVGRRAPGLPPGRSIVGRRTRQTYRALTSPRSSATAARSNGRSPRAAARRARQDAPSISSPYVLDCPCAAHPPAPSSVARKPLPPGTHRAARADDLAPDRPPRPPAAASSTSGPAHQPPLCGRRPHPGLERGPLVRRQHDRRRLLDRHAQPLSWHIQLC